jgi:hypothetical protein
MGPGLASLRHTGNCTPPQTRKSTFVEMLVQLGPLDDRPFGSITRHTS